jgi:hypothetical protein
MAMPIKSMQVVTHPMTNTANNVATALTKSGVEGQSWFVSYVNWRVSGGAIGGSNVSVSILDGEILLMEQICQ